LQDSEQYFLSVLPTIGLPHKIQLSFCIAFCFNNIKRL